MSYRKAKSAPKQYIVDQDQIKKLVLETMKDVSDLVGRTLGPGGKLAAIESDHIGISDKITKDGVSVFKSMGHINPYKHMLIEIARNSSERTASEAGDGTTTTAILAYNLIQNIFNYCEKKPKESPQKVVRNLKKAVQEILVPYIAERSIKVGEENKDLLQMVAKISSNGDKELADAVIKCFEEVGFGESSHVTIREVPGPSGYKVERIEGFPIPVGYEETSGKYHSAFINDNGNQRCFIEKPKFILFDGTVHDFTQFELLLNTLSKAYQAGNKDYENIVFVANGFSENVISTLAYNFPIAGTCNIIPIVSPMAQFLNCQSHFLADLAAFTGAKVFGMKDQVGEASINDLGNNMASFECYRFRSTVIGDPDPVNIEFRADEIRKMKTRAESRAEETWFDERLGKITNGIAKLTISGGSMGEIKEKSDRADDAICAVRSTIAHGCLPGGCRIAIDMALELTEKIPDAPWAEEILVPAFLKLHHRLLENAGYNEEEYQQILEKLVNERDVVYDVENQVFGNAQELGLFDATKAVSESLNNALSIASVLGTLGGIVVHPRDGEFERSEAKADEEFRRATENPDAYQNPSRNKR
jgi:chaperonin GroEL